MVGDSLLVCFFSVDIKALKLISSYGMVKAEEYVVRTVPSICILCQNVILNERTATESKLEKNTSYFVVPNAPWTWDL